MENFSFFHPGIRNFFVCYAMELGILGASSEYRIL